MAPGASSGDYLCELTGLRVVVFEALVQQIVVVGTFGILAHV